MLFSLNVTFKSVSLTFRNYFYFYTSFFRVWIKLKNKEVKLTLESNHVEDILELCKIAKTRKTMDMAYGKRCEDANIPVTKTSTCMSVLETFDRSLQQTLIS
ncbi:hypothetical protein HID58_090578 [Brassica napus]|uniref:Uncharacterized protein n=1 Tax=Brassica napus TaxID=3708 RepID=A0ABQ7WZ05_BRANA|nr:hypothetical protein HID58_090578 [Brassica napus]